MQRHGLLRYRHIYGKQNTSDILTKPVDTQVYKTIMQQIQDGAWSEMIRENELLEFGESDN